MARYRLQAGRYIQSEVVLKDGKPVEDKDGNKQMKEHTYEATQGHDGKVCAPFCDVESWEDLEAKFGKGKFISIAHIAEQKKAAEAAKKAQ